MNITFSKAANFKQRPIYNIMDDQNKVAGFIIQQRARSRSGAASWTLQIGSSAEFNGDFHKCRSNAKIYFSKLRTFVAHKLNDNVALQPIRTPPYTCGNLSATCCYPNCGCEWTL